MVLRSGTRRSGGNKISEATPTKATPSKATPTKATPSKSSKKPKKIPVENEASPLKAASPETTPVEVEDDEAPEAITFSDARMEVLSAIRQQKERRTEVANAQKNARKRKHDLYKSQKEEKAKRKATMDVLPTDLLEEVAKEDAANVKKNVVTKFDEDFQVDSEEEETEEEASGFAVLTRKDETKLCSVAESVMNLKKNLFFGSRVRREDVQDRWRREDKMRKINSAKIK